MDDFTPTIHGEGGRWTESEVLGSYAVVKVRASQATLDAIAGTAGYFRLPLAKLDLTLGQLTQQQRTNIRDRILAMGYSQTEINNALGSDWQNVTLRQVLRFMATRRLKPRWDADAEEIKVDGIIQSCRSIESVNKEIPDED
jgi:hypothetical protein